MYYCFGCGAGGNVFTFLMEYENYTFPEALKVLADRAGVSLPEVEYSAGSKRAGRFKKRSCWKSTRLAAKYFYYQLRAPQGEKAMEYLKGRELSDETIAQVWSWLCRTVQQRICTAI